MTPQQQRFRRAAIAGFIFGLMAIFNFLTTPLIGLTASYFQTMLEGSAEPLLSNPTGWQLSIYALYWFFIAPISFIAVTIFWAAALEAVARSERTWIYDLTRWFVTGIFIFGMFLGVGFQYIFVRNSDPARLPDMAHFLFSILFMHNIMVYLAALGVALEGYLAHTLPIGICLALICTELALMTFDFAALNPDIHAAKFIIGLFVGTIRMILLAAYFWIVSLPRPSIDLMETVTPT